MANGMKPWLACDDSGLLFGTATSLMEHADYRMAGVGPRMNLALVIL